jgi:hypothetical protein
MTLQLLHSEFPQYMMTIRFSFLSVKEHGVVKGWEIKEHIQRYKECADMTMQTEFFLSTVHCVFRGFFSVRCAMHRLQ